MSSQIGMFDETNRTARNTTLVDYGIQSEGSHYRAHVAYVAQRVYVFPTASGKKAIDRGVYERAQAKTQGIVTAEGYKVPTSHIDGLSEVFIPLSVYRQFKIEAWMPTGEKGRLATYIVATMMKDSLIPLPVVVDFTDDRALQIKGTDIIVGTSLHVQVKLDYYAGDKRSGGTGNLFLQVAECNPFRQY